MPRKLLLRAGKMIRDGAKIIATAAASVLCCRRCVTTYTAAYSCDGPGWVFQNIVQECTRCAAAPYETWVVNGTTATYIHVGPLCLIRCTCEEATPPALPDTAPEGFPDGCHRGWRADFNCNLQSWSVAPTGNTPAPLSGWSPTGGCTAGCVVGLGDTPTAPNWTPDCTYQYTATAICPAGWDVRYVGRTCFAATDWAGDGCSAVINSPSPDPPDAPAWAPDCTHVWEDDGSGHWTDLGYFCSYAGTLGWTISGDWCVYRTVSTSTPGSAPPGRKPANYLWAWVCGDGVVAMGRTCDDVYDWSPLRVCDNTTVTASSTTPADPPLLPYCYAIWSADCTGAVTQTGWRCSTVELPACDGTWSDPDPVTCIRTTCTDGSTPPSPPPCLPPVTHCFVTWSFVCDPVQYANHRHVVAIRTVCEPPGSSADSTVRGWDSTNTCVTDAGVCSESCGSNGTAPDVPAGPCCYGIANCHCCFSEDSLLAATMTVPPGRALQGSHSTSGMHLASIESDAGLYVSATWKTAGFPASATPGDLFEYWSVTYTYDPYVGQVGWIITLTLYVWTGTTWTPIDQIISDRSGDGCAGASWGAGGYSFSVAVSNNDACGCVEDNCIPTENPAP